MKTPKSESVGKKYQDLIKNKKQPKTGDFKKILDEEKKKREKNN